ncbi:hypothetical protein CD943_04630 [Brevundimonas diminuta]|uniref:Uncharacterized protein n=2 Tax=Brevundimonas diminuta TaxID=293 RepID=A0A1Z3LW58_BREDI|nr:hypothetical protein CD943_04630 [Brevundimonas diminuta]
MLLDVSVADLPSADYADHPQGHVEDTLVLVWETDRTGIERGMVRQTTFVAGDGVVLRAPRFRYAVDVALPAFRRHCAHAHQLMAARQALCGGADA